MLAHLKNKLVVFLGHFDVDVDIDVGVTVDFNFYDPIHFVVKFDIYVATLEPVHVKAILG